MKNFIFRYSENFSQNFWDGCSPVALMEEQPFVQIIEDRCSSKMYIKFSSYLTENTARVH